MANFIQKLFGKPRKDADEFNLQVSPYKSLMDIPAGSALNKRILSGLGGEGIGYGEDFVNRSTSPFVAQLQADLPDLMKNTQETYSARGLGRSTPVARDINKVQAQSGRDINQLLSQAYLTNEQQKKTDEARYQNLASQFTGQEAGQRNTAAQFDMNRLLQEKNLQNQYDTQNSGYLSRMVGTGLKVAAAPFTGGASLATIGDMGGGGVSQFGNVYGTDTPKGVTDTGSFSQLPGGFVQGSSNVDLQKILSMLGSMGGGL